MRLGVNVPNFGPGTNRTVLADWARTVEGLGYDLLMMSDHVAITDDVAQRYPAPFFDPLTTLAWLAGRTERIRLGTTVLIAPYRDPLLLARTTATLNELSDGRLVLGVGVGWAEQEFAALGLPFHRRGAMTDEYLAAFRTLWTDGVAEFNGVDVHGVGTAQPPVWIGGNGDAALRRTIRFGDAWHPLGLTVPEFAAGVTRLAELAQAAARPMPELAPRIRVHLDRVADTVAEVAELAALGADVVVLDPYHGDPEQTRHPQSAWAALAAIAAETRP